MYLRVTKVTIIVTTLKNTTKYTKGYLNLKGIRIISTIIQNIVKGVYRVVSPLMGVTKNQHADSCWR